MTIHEGGEVLRFPKLNLDGEVRVYSLDTHQEVSRSDIAQIASDAFDDAIESAGGELDVPSRAVEPVADVIPLFRRRKH